MAEPKSTKLPDNLRCLNTCLGIIGWNSGDGENRIRILVFSTSTLTDGNWKEVLNAQNDPFRQREIMRVSWSNDRISA